MPTGHKEKLLGKKFGRLTVTAEMNGSRKYLKRWYCACICGGKAIVTSYNLKSKHTQSCGCLFKEEAMKARTKHGSANRGKKTYLYHIWCAMRKRCNNKNDPAFINYGGRGITVCKRWDDFNLFKKDIGERPNKKLTLERVNNNSGYSPSNCKWATRSEQNLNKRKKK